MSDTAPSGEELTEAESQTEPEATDTDAEETDWKAEAEKWTALARKHEERAKANSKAAKDLEELRQQSMTDQEKAVEQAKAEARAAAFTEVGGKLAAAEVRAAAAGRLSAEQVDTLLDGLNVSRFLTEDGDVDGERVAAFVDGIAPKQDENPTFPDLGQGVRSTGGTRSGSDMDSLLRQAVTGRK